MHVDKLEYGWWERKRGNGLLPTTIGQKNNYVLTAEEMIEYAQLLDGMAKDLQAQAASARITAKALKTGRVASWEPTPVCFTLAHVLELMVTMAKHKLAITQFLLRCSERAVKLLSTKGE